MEYAPHPQTPLYLEGYLYLLYAADHPETAREEAATALAVEVADCEQLLPVHENPDDLREALTEVLSGSLRAAAEDLGVAIQQPLTVDDAELLMYYALGSWPDAQRRASDLTGESPSLRSVGNPLADLMVIQQIWDHRLDRRRSTPPLEKLIPRGEEMVE